MNTKTFLAILFLGTADAAAAVHTYYYHHTEPTFHPAAQEYVNPYHTMMKNLASNPALAHNQELMDTVITYIKNSSSSRVKGDIMQALASNPSVCTDPRLAHLIQESLEEQRKQKEQETVFILGAFAAIGITALIYAVVQSITPRPVSAHICYS